jgi:hypothetical protein
VINRIDVSSVLRTSVCDLYSNLVTRPTGAMVRLGIEHQLDEIGDRALAILDFSHVRLLDFSCADEIVAKLLLQYVSVDIPRREVYFVFYGMSESHMDAIETVLQRHSLALVSQLADGNPRLLGVIDDEQRRIWETIRQLGSAEPSEVASSAGISAEHAKRTLENLWRRRLVIRDDHVYVSLCGGSPGTRRDEFAARDHSPSELS